MTTYDSAYCLAWLKRLLARPTADEIADATYYQWLSESQNKVIADLASRAPWTLYPKVAYGSIPTLTTTDNQVFTFGTDANGFAIVPIGKAKIFTSLASIPDTPWVEGYDYLNEGSQIRIPNNRTYSGTLYYRAVTQPKDIAAGGSNEPALIPEASRELIVLRSVVDFGDAGGLRPDLSQRYESKYAEAFSRWMLVWKTQFASGGALAYPSSTLQASLIGGSLGSLIVSP